MVPQNIADGGVGDEQTDIGQRALDAIVASSCVFPSHAQHHLDDFESNTGTSDIVVPEKWIWFVIAGLVPFCGWLELQGMES